MKNKEALYVHVPWCRRRCPYCDFYIVVGKPESSFVDALIGEFNERRSPWLQGEAASLYFGGGTPSMLMPQEIGRLIQYFFDHKALRKDAEITLEANPEDLDDAYVEALTKTPINRISLGIQSFDDKILRFLGRMHQSAEALSALQRLKAHGLNNISVDLIIGVPNEEPAQILKSIDMLFEAGIPHLSTYLLTIEEKTNFYKRIKANTMVEPKEEEQVSIYKMVQKKLKSLGYLQYDISSYGLFGFFSQHNQVYWAKGSYLGLGPGAHSMRFSDKGIERAHNALSLREWLTRPRDLANFVFDRLDNNEALKESLAFGLRNMDQGIDISELEQRHGCAVPKDFAAAIQKMINFGWLTLNKDCLTITEDGALFADAIMAEILSC